MFETIEVSGGVAIGLDAPCFLIAELGINHNGDVDLAHKLVDAAADAGADAIKIQNYRTEDFIAARTQTYEYKRGIQTIRESQFEMFKRCELPHAALREIAQHSSDRDMVFFGTPTSQAGVDELIELGAVMLKNGSDYLGNLPLIRAMALSSLPTLISVGMSTAQDIQDAVGAFKDAGGKHLVLMQCTSTYPAPLEDLNLRRIKTLRADFNCLAGFSDHSRGTLAAETAVALGAVAIEKHFTLDRSLPGPDHGFSADPQEFRSLTGRVREVEVALGSRQLGPTASESQSREEYRLSCAAASDLDTGHVVQEQDIAFNRPGTGLPPKRISDLIGQRLAVPMRRGELFTAQSLGTKR